jgi:hypothetical protein
MKIRESGQVVGVEVDSLPSGHAERYMSSHYKFIFSEWLTISCTCRLRVATMVVGLETSVGGGWEKVLEKTMKVKARFRDVPVGPPTAWVPGVFVPPKFFGRAITSRPHPFGEGRGRYGRLLLASNPHWRRIHVGVESMFLMSNPCCCRRIPIFSVEPISRRNRVVIVACCRTCCRICGVFLP